MAAPKKKYKEKVLTAKMRKKLLVVFLIVALATTALSVVLIRLNLNKGEAYSKAVYDNFTYDSRVLNAKRGDITDRNGTILAYSAKVYNLIIDAKVMLSSEDFREPTVALLLKYFPQIDAKELNTYLDTNKEAANRESYRRLLMHLTADDIADFKEAMGNTKNIKGVWFEEEYSRMYPYGSLAADLLGFASEANGGEIGMEIQYESYLAGTNGRTYGYIDSNSYISETINPTNGGTVVSTIDYTVQNIVEEAIRNFNKEYGSASTSVVVMNPTNGEILAMADYPTFDLNHPRDLTSVYTDEQIQKMTDEEVVAAYYKLWSNSTISWMYEPGSVFKTFVIGAAMEEGIIGANDCWLCDGAAVYNGTTIRCNNREGHGNLTTAGALVNSCNDALMQIGARLGVTRFNGYLSRYQLGRKTGIDLPGEEAGMLIDSNNMMDVDLATNSFGQNLNVTMVQMMSTFSSMINGGHYYQPHVVKEILNASGDTVKTFEPVEVSRTISEETSKILDQFLRCSVDYGGYVSGRVEGYSMGAKSGTAEKAGREEDSYVVSFMGFLTAENPEVLIYVVIDDPQVELYYNSWAAQVVFHEIAEKMILYYGIPQADTEYWLDFKITPEDEQFVRAPYYDPDATVITTPMPEDERISGTGEEDENIGDQTDLAQQYPDGANPAQVIKPEDSVQNGDEAPPNEPQNNGDNQQNAENQGE